MILYFNQGGKLTVVKEKVFNLERDIQKIFEENLIEIMAYEVVKSEFSVKDRRIDTLAFDNQNNAFIIIEYKRDKNNSVFDQGMTYLSLMLENKADFIVAYNESLNRSLKLKEIEWDQTRVVFVSTSFTDIQIRATNFKDIAIELWEITQYDNNIIAINPIKKTPSAESIKPIARRSNVLKNVSKEIKVYTEQDHLIKASESTVELYEKFKTAILNLQSGIEIEPKKVYIAFKKTKNILYIVVQNKSLKILILAGNGELNDTKKIGQDATKERWGNGSYKILVKDDSNLEYIMSLIRQVIE